MNQDSIRRMMPSELKCYFKYITNDFPVGEYPPRFVLERHMKSGKMEGLIFSDGNTDVAYAICAAGHGNGYVLLSLFAVLQEFRGMGVGSGFLKAITDYYSHKKAIFVEVERPELALDNQELITRRRRVEFYERAGFIQLSGIDYTIWDVPMHLMVYPADVGLNIPETQLMERIREIYLQLLGRAFIHKLAMKHI